MSPSLQQRVTAVTSETRECGQGYLSLIKNLFSALRGVPVVGGVDWLVCRRFGEVTCFSNVYYYAVKNDSFVVVFIVVRR